jgi:hypothetical protein
VLGTVRAKPEKKDMNKVKITATDTNKLNTLFDNQIDAIKERLGVKDEEEDSEQDEEEKLDEILEEEKSPEILIAKRVLQAT